MAYVGEVFPFQPGRAQIVITFHHIADEAGCVPVKLMENFPIPGAHTYETAYDDNQLAAIQFKTSGQIFGILAIRGLNRGGQSACNVKKKIIDATKAFMKLAEEKLWGTSRYAFSFPRNQNYKRDFMAECVILGCLEHWNTKDCNGRLMYSNIEHVAIVPDPQDKNDSIITYLNAARKTDLLMSTFRDSPMMNLVETRAHFMANSGKMGQTQFGWAPAAIPDPLPPLQRPQRRQ